MYAVFKELSILAFSKIAFLYFYYELYLVHNMKYKNKAFLRFAFI
jgi:hypothetical protein